MSAEALGTTFLILLMCILVGSQGNPDQEAVPGQPVQAGHPQGQQVHVGQPAGQQVHVGQPAGQQVHVGQPAGQPAQQVHQMNRQGNPNIIKVSSQDRDHIMEHLDGVIEKPESEMSPEELQHHYFKLHDYDNNNKLDGTELIQAITHYHVEEEEEGGKVMTEEELMSLLDPILQNEDRNWDGYIDYPEYAKSQGKS